MVVPAAYKKAIQSLWTGLATITVRQGVSTLPMAARSRWRK